MKKTKIVNTFQVECTSEEFLLLTNTISEMKGLAANKKPVPPLIVNRFFKYFEGAIFDLNAHAADIVQEAKTKFTNYFEQQEGYDFSTKDFSFFELTLILFSEITIQANKSEMISEVHNIVENYFLRRKETLKVFSRYKRNVVVGYTLFCLGYALSEDLKPYSISGIEPRCKELADAVKYHTRKTIKKPRRTLGF